MGFVNKELVTVSVKYYLVYPVASMKYEDWTSTYDYWQNQARVQERRGLFIQNNLYLFSSRDGLRFVIVLHVHKAGTKKGNDRREGAD